MKEFVLSMTEVMQLLNRPDFFVRVPMFSRLQKLVRRQNEAMAKHGASLLHDGKKCSGCYNKTKVGAVRKQMKRAFGNIVQDCTGRPVELEPLRYYIRGAFKTESKPIVLLHRPTENSKVKRLAI